MSCRRVCRELLWLSRFGELGPSSAPHLDHLAGCRSCRDEVGLDRALVQQLRVALAERITDAEPSDRAWQTILKRARTPEPRPMLRVWEWTAALVGRLRTATAMAGTGLALVLALNMELVTVVAPEDPVGARTDSASLWQVPRLPVERTTPATAAADAAAPPSPRSDPETLMTQAEARIAAPTVHQPVTVEPAEETVTTEVRVVFRPLQSPEPRRAAAQQPAGAGAAPWIPADTRPGQPS